MGINRVVFDSNDIFSQNGAFGWLSWTTELLSMRIRKGLQNKEDTKHVKKQQGGG